MGFIFLYDAAAGVMTRHQDGMLFRVLLHMIQWPQLPATSSSFNLSTFYCLFSLVNAQLMLGVPRSCQPWAQHEAEEGWMAGWMELNKNALVFSLLSFSSFLPPINQPNNNTRTVQYSTVQCSIKIGFIQFILEYRYTAKVDGLYCTSYYCW